MTVSLLNENQLKILLMNRYSENNNNKKDMFAFTLKKQNCQFSKRKKKKVVKRDYPEISNCCQYEVACFHGY